MSKAMEVLAVDIVVFENHSMRCSKACINKFCILP